jgi:hypothetical protein
MGVVYAVMRCKCCLTIKPVWLDHGGKYYCSFSCADAWGECVCDRALLVVARAKRAREHLEDAEAAIARGRLAS